MLCALCLGHFEYSHKTREEFSRLKYQTAQAIRRHSTNKDIVKLFEEDADTFARSLHGSQNLCPWLLGDISGVPSNLPGLQSELDIWDKARPGVDIAQNAANGCELCIRISTAVSWMPRFYRSNGIENQQTSSIPCPENMRHVNVSSWLELRPATRRPELIRFLIQAVPPGSGDHAWLRLDLYTQIESEFFSFEA